MVQSEAYDLISHLLTVGTSLKIRGHRCNVVDRNTGRVGGEFFRATDVTKVYDAEGREIDGRSEEHTSELQSLMRISYAVFCLKKKKQAEHIRDRTDADQKNREYENDKQQKQQDNILI